MQATLTLLARPDCRARRRRVVETLQRDLGCRCNPSRLHRRLDAGHRRRGPTARARVDAVIDVLAPARAR
ncbi:MAG: hypothetical protein KGJ30_11415 [Burkholderiales bacterium]|nr:hypothetical protein [Burkholderiales bacterium]